VADTSTSLGLNSPLEAEKGKPAPGHSWPLAVGGLIVYSLCVLGAGRDDVPWFAPLGIGLALTAWLGLWFVVLLAADFFILQMALGDQNRMGDSVLLGLQIASSWWCYARLARGARTLDDPRSAVVFLLLVPGALAGLFAGYQAFIWSGSEGQFRSDFWSTLGTLWRGRALGIMILTPALLAILTPVWVARGWIQREAREPGTVAALPRDWTWGEAVEVIGLASAGGVLGVVVAVLQVRQGVTSWSLWGLLLLVVVWAGLRQGLRGGAVAAGAAGLLGLSLVSIMEGDRDRWLPLQGNFLAQCCVALLVGGSVGWIRASELRYRQIIGHIPVVLYSVRVPRWVPARLVSQGSAAPSKAELSAGDAVVRAAETTLVSPACKSILGCDAAALIGPFSAWLERILPADRELVIAALTQLCLQRQPVTCEYRLVSSVPAEPAVVHTGSAADKSLPALGPRSAQRWVRDTLAPHYSPDGHLDGWEGIVEDITEQRVLAHDLRHASAMLHALVTHLPTGIYFVQAPFGQPILVNNRARQLLGQREDLAAGLSHLSKVYRLHRPDGTEYPWEELPVTKALRDGATSMAEDIVVHRADGRHITLISWAAPVDLGGQGQPPAAVWVLEDLSTLKQVEVGRQESESSR